MSNEPEAQAQPDETPPPAAESIDATLFEAELAKTRDELLRALAEVENTRRRGERQAQDARTYAIDRFARDLLPVADTLHRALAAIPSQVRDNADESIRTVLAGVEMTERAMIDAFARHGIKRIGAKGEPFDPNLHQAVAQAPSDAPAGTVAEVMQPGYVLGDRTLRAAMVLVSAGPPATPPTQEGPPTSSVDIKV